MSAAGAYRVAVALVALAGSATAVVEYGDLARHLAGRPFLARGAIASSEWQDVLARAGRPRTRRAYEDARGAGTLPAQISGVAVGWSFVTEAAEGLPPDARVYLDVPSELFYYYGTTLWYPARVEVGSHGAVIAGGEALRAAAVHVDPKDLPALRAAGFTHVVALTERGVRLLDLRDPAGGSR